MVLLTQVSGLCSESRGYELVSCSVLGLLVCTAFSAVQLLVSWSHCTAVQLAMQGGPGLSIEVVCLVLVLFSVLLVLLYGCRCS
jgi:hypothetical protein